MRIRKTIAALVMLIQSCTGMATTYDVAPSKQPKRIYRASFSDIRECEATIQQRKADYERYMVSEDYSLAVIELVRCADVLQDKSIQQLVDVAEEKNSLSIALSVTSTEGQRINAIEYLKNRSPDTYALVKADIERIQSIAKETENETKDSEPRSASPEVVKKLPEVVAQANIKSAIDDRLELYKRYYKKRARLTLSKYYDISDGMSYRKVVEILGGLGQEISRSSFDGIPRGMPGVYAVMYQWVGTDGATLTALFQNDILVSKAQFGLR